MALRLALSQRRIGMYEWGRTITFKIYNEDGTAFNASTDSLTTITVKTYKRPGDHALFFRDVAKALQVVRNVAQIVENIAGAWTTQASGVGTFAYSETARIGVGGTAWIQVILSNADGTKQFPTTLEQIFVEAGQDI